MNEAHLDPSTQDTPTIRFSARWLQGRRLFLVAAVGAIFLGIASGQAGSSEVASGIDTASDPDTRPFTGTPIDGYRLTWSDEFAGNAVDESRWYYRLDCKHWSQQKAENNLVSAGFLRIKLRKEPTDCPKNRWLQPGQSEGDEPAGVVQYSGGGVISHQLFRYGYYEARLKVPSTAGWHTSFWMMADLTKEKDPSDLEFDPLANDDLNSHIELDPFENNSNDLKHYQTDAHQWKPEPGTADPGRTQNKVGTRQIRFTDDTSLDQFHVYGMVFTESTLQYFFDGKLVSETSFPAARYKHNDVSIWLTSIGTYLGGVKAIDDSHLPVEVQIDYVRFFEKAQ